MLHPYMDAPVAGAEPFRRVTRKRVFNRTGAATTVNDMYMFDIAMSANATEAANSKGLVLPPVANWNWGPNELASVWNNIVVVTAAEIFQGLYCIALEAVADNEELEVLEIGATTMNVRRAADGTEASGALVIPNAAVGSVLAQRAQSTSRHVGYTLESKALLAATPTAVRCYFNGLGPIS